MAYTTIDNPELYFQTKLYTGNANDGSGTTQAVTLDGSENLQPDWVWIKSRSATKSHYLFDVVRGVTKELNSNNANDENTNTQGLQSFNSDGFTLGSEPEMNENGTTYVSWNWKAGTSFTNDASATSIGTIDSTGSASDISGFSVVSYTGTGSSGTIKHGLSTAPSMVIIKNRSHDSKSWIIAQKSIGYANGIFLNLSDAKASEGSAFNSTAPTSSVFTVGNTSLVNDSGDNYIAYCFADIQGYSKVSGSYIGNGNASGPMIVTGFSPAWLMIKQTAAANDWFIIDNKREPFNPNNVQLVANGTSASTNKGDLDLLSNGFKPRSSNAAWNENNAQYIYMAFAENPFVTSSGVPTTAR